MQALVGGGVAVILVAVIAAAVFYRSQHPDDSTGALFDDTASNGSAPYDHPRPVTRTNVVDVNDGETRFATTAGIDVSAPGVDDVSTPVPVGEDVGQMLLTVTGSRSAGSPDSAGWGLGCVLGEESARPVRYRLDISGDGSWEVIRQDGAAAPFQDLSLATGVAGSADDGSTVGLLCANGDSWARVLIYVDGALKSDVLDQQQGVRGDLGWKATLWALGSADGPSGRRFSSVEVSEMQVGYTDAADVEWKPGS